MRTIKTKVYQFNELNEDAKQQAISWYREGADDMQIYSREIIDSVKKVAEIFDLRFGRSYTDVRTSHISDNILELNGVRLYKFIVNNYYNYLFKPTWIKIIHKAVRYPQFICKVNEGKNGPYTMLYSKNRKDKSCTLTGVCYDMDILEPVYTFLKQPGKYTTFADLMNEIEHAINKTFTATEDWVNSDEFIIDTIQANEYEFTKEGNKF